MSAGAIVFTWTVSTIPSAVRFGRPYRDQTTPAGVSTVVNVNVSIGSACQTRKVP